MGRLCGAIERASVGAWRNEPAARERNIAVKQGDVVGSKRRPLDPRACADDHGSGAAAKVMESWWLRCLTHGYRSMCRMAAHALPCGAQRTSKTLFGRELLGEFTHNRHGQAGPGW